MKKLILFGLPLIFVSCLSRYPISTKEFWGVPMTCKTDSSTLFNDTPIKIKKGVTVRPLYCPSCKYHACDNKPDFFDLVFFWPVNITLDFKKKEYTFLYSPSRSVPGDQKTQSGETKYSLSYSIGNEQFVYYQMDYGTLSYNKKRQIITLNSKIYNWIRTFAFSYSRQDSVLTLSGKNSN